MFGFSSLRCCDCEYLDLKDKNRYGEAYCPVERDYVSLDSYTCRSFVPNFYVMTVYCKINNLAFDIDIMRILIGLRDNYMTKNEVGKNFLEEYEQIGPLLAVRLQTDMYKSDVVADMRDNYINPSVEFVLSGRYFEAQETYIEMVNKLKVRYGYEPIKLNKSKQKRL